MPPRIPVEFLRILTGGRFQQAGNRVQIEDYNGNAVRDTNPLPVTMPAGGGAVVAIDQTTPGTTNNVTVAGQTAADDAVATGNPLVIGAIADETAPNLVDEGDIGWLRMTLSRLLRVETSREAGATAAHRTVTALDGRYPPLNSDANWLANPGQREKARFFVDIVARGCTALADDPVLTFRPYLRNGGVGGYVAAGDYVSYTRPRLQDLSPIKFQKTVDNGANYTDYSANVIDNNPATYADLDALDTSANGDWFIIGGPVPFCGAALDMTANVNTNNSVMTVEYWNGGAWVAVANLVDGTIIAAGKTLSGDGQISWNIPAAWATSLLGALTAYWVRVSVSAALSATVEVAECDLLMPIKPAIDVWADGDDVLLMVQSQDAAVTGTMAYSGTIRASWR